MGHPRLLAWTGLAVIAAAALARNLPHLAPGMFDWAEPGNVAAALAQGRGFSDPFDGKTGATAWVSPLPAFVEAAVFLVLGVKTAASAKALLALTVLGLAAAHLVLIDALAPYGAWMRGAASATFLAYVSLLPGSPVTVLSEAWLDILLSAALLWAALATIRSPDRGSAAALVLVGLLAPLVYAGIARAAGFVVLGRAWRRRREPGCLAVPAAAAAALVFSTGAWTARNAVALGRFVPLKSNFWFELHLANVDSRDGLPRMEEVLRRLPFFDTGEFNRYKEMGEIRYVESFKAPALAEIRRDPLHFAANIVRRIKVAAVFCPREGGGQPTQAAFGAADQALLVNSGELISLGSAGGLWTRMDAPIPSAFHKLHALGLKDPEGVWGDWSEKRLAYDAQFRSTAGTALGYLTAGVPFLALLLSAVLLGGRLAPPAAWAATIATAMLLPFILVNHNERHQLPILAKQAVAIGAFAQAAADRLVRGRAPA